MTHRCCRRSRPRLIVPSFDPVRSQWDFQVKSRTVPDFYNRNVRGLKLRLSGNNHYLRSLESCTRVFLIKYSVSLDKHRGSTSDELAGNRHTEGNLLKSRAFLKRIEKPKIKRTPIGLRFCMFFELKKAYLRRNRRPAKPKAPRPKIAIEVGSGTSVFILQATLTAPPEFREKAIWSVASIAVRSPS